MSQPFKLYRLQLLDSQLDQARARISEIDTALQEDKILRQARQKAEDCRANLEKAQKNLRRAEDNVRAQQIKIEQSESALYGGKVRNPKELQDLQNEVAALKRYLQVLEDRQLEAMIASEEAEAVHNQASDMLDKIENEVTVKHQELSNEKSQLLQNVERLEIERQAAVSSIPAEDRKLYNQLRQARRGVAVAIVNDKACSACGTTLTTGLLHAARSPNQITRCDTCGRILYFG